MKYAVSEDFNQILDNGKEWTDMWNKWKSS